MVFVYGGITWTDAFSLILCYVTVAFFAGSIGICFSAAFKRSTVSTVVTYGTLTAVVAGTYFLNRFALSVSGMDLQRSAAYVLGESSAKASSGGFFYLFLLNPAVTFMAVIGGQAGRGTPLADIVSYFGIPENGFIIKHWIGFSILIQLAAGMAVQLGQYPPFRGKEKGCPRGQTRAARGRQTDQPSGICLWSHFNSWMEGCQVTQCEKVLRHLRTFGSITPMEAMQEYGIMRLGARCWDLRNSGIPVVSEIVAGKNRFGETTHYAKYRLEDRNVTGN